jgi:hypothetical protein
MSGILIKVLIFLVIAAAIGFGMRRIWRDWKAQFQAHDKARQKRDLTERRRPDVITLERDKDGTFRPPDQR